MATASIEVRVEIIEASERSEALSTCLAQTGERADVWFWLPWLQFEIETWALPATRLTECVIAMMTQ